MTAAYAYHLDAGSPAVQSGRPHSILRNFRQLGVEVRELFPLLEVGVWQRNYRKISNRLLAREYLLDRDETLLRGFADQLHAGLRRTAAQFVFSPSTLPLSYLETDLPVTFCADAPFCAMVDYYGSFTRLSRPQIDLSEMLEARVISQASLAVYPTRWAADQAIQGYGADPAKVAVIPFGANFGSRNRPEEVLPWIEERAARQPVRLLFVGREWERKGGDIVVATAAWLRAKGLDVEVDLVGCTVPSRHRHLDYLHPHGPLSPRRPEQEQALTKLYQQAHFLFVPSRAEAYGMVFCEANAFGLPAISTATGGISGVIRSGVNGHALPMEAREEDYGRVILDVMESRESYTAMAQNSFREFEQRLNWETFSRNFLARIGEAKFSELASHAGAGRSKNPPSPVEIHSPEPTHERAPADTPPAPAAPLRVAFVANDYFDPVQVGAWSGLPYFIWQSLEKQGVEIQIIRLSSSRNKAWRWLKFGAAKLLARRRYLRDRDTALLRSYARQIERALVGREVDFLFCPGTAPVAYVETKIPIAFWVDASFAGMADFYGSFTRLTKGSLAEGHASDQAALERSALAIYSSDWAAESVRHAYRVDPAQLHVVRFGANLNQAPDETQIREIIRQRETETCRLLLVGVDWERKGAGIALAALDELGALGVRARLTVIGCHPPPGLKLPPNVEIIGFVSKGTEEGRQLIERYFRESHFFFMPTRAEAYGLVFCEANAFGLPCVATDVGGVPSIIEDGANGCLLPPTAPPSEFAACIMDIWRDRELYETYALNCHRIYRERLNWDSAGRKVAELLRTYLAEKRPAIS